jgi:hypothetical protein
MMARMGGASALLRAHRAPTVHGPIWLVADANREVCLFAGDPPAYSCEPAPLALRRGIVLGVVENPAESSKRRFLLYGVVPDGRPTVRIKVGNHASRSVRVRHGAFSVRARQPVVKI